MFIEEREQWLCTVFEHSGQFLPHPPYPVFWIHGGFWAVHEAHAGWDVSSCPGAYSWCAAHGHGAVAVRCSYQGCVFVVDLPPSSGLAGSCPMFSACFRADLLWPAGPGHTFPVGPRAPEWAAGGQDHPPAEPLLPPDPQQQGCRKGAEGRAWHVSILPFFLCWKEMGGRRAQRWKPVSL